MKYNRIVKYWLVLGCVMLFFQIFIGGVTRITGSGLSITKWEIVTGTLPPLTTQAWEEAFDLYKDTPQYKKINQGMSMGDFKFIYFWEYLHRLWARTMGFVFLFPFIWFVFKKWIDPWMIKQLAYVFLCAMLAALFGWIMVASGLVDRPWVNAYKLSLHLGIALATMGFLVWGTYKAFSEKTFTLDNSILHRMARTFFIFLIIQIFFGAIVSGMRASLYYPSWPDMNGQYIPDILWDASLWTWENIVDYDKDALMPALIHVLHRHWAYVVYAFGLWFFVKILKYPLPRILYVLAWALFVLLNLQVLIGILTLLNSQTTIPVFYGVLHQAIAIFIFCISLYFIFTFKRRAYP